MVAVVKEDKIQNTAEFDTIPEIVREEVPAAEVTAAPMGVTPRQAERAAAYRNAPQSAGAYAYEEGAPAPDTSVLERIDALPQSEFEVRKGDELETLWPGFHHELIQPAKRPPAFYTGIGFAAGVIVTLMGLGGFTLVNNHLTAVNNAAPSNIIVQGAASGAQDQGMGDERNTVPQNVDPHSVIVPISSTYEVKSGDTLAMIAIKNYHKATPRLIDEIVAANDMKSANVLKQGQKLKLPTYRTQASKIAASKSNQIN